MYHLDSGPRAQTRPLCGVALAGDTVQPDIGLADCPRCILRHEAATAQEGDVVSLDVARLLPEGTTIRRAEGPGAPYRMLTKRRGLWCRLDKQTGAGIGAGIGAGPWLIVHLP